MPSPARVIDQHPAKNQIIDALLAATPIREVAAKFGISVMTVQRYRKTVVQPAVKWHRTLEVTEKKPVAAVTQHVIHPQQIERATALPSVLERLRRRNERRDEWIDAAEQAENFSALGTYDSNGLREIELECKLTGLLSDGANQVATTINLVCGSAAVSVTSNGAVPDAVPGADDALEITAGPADL